MSKVHTCIEARVNPPRKAEHEWRYPCLLQAPCDAVFLMSDNSWGTCIAEGRKVDANKTRYSLGRHYAVSPYAAGFCTFEGTVELKGFVS